MTVLSVNVREVIETGPLRDENWNLSIILFASFLNNKVLFMFVRYRTDLVLYL
ncbi:protein of unknown function [Legionella longbeachae NSW150]|uniref:Uncharacterized protein n=1 Tax=Legionella longbeachae serogroup 1 (strain NSW150) TaxID=661367 RepID=D3HM38_LEGLN|nr:protein of unknown function [Legionella longbeachae NSW150]